MTPFQAQSFSSNKSTSKPLNVSGVQQRSTSASIIALLESDQSKPIDEALRALKGGALDLREHQVSFAAAVALAEAITRLKQADGQIPFRQLFLGGIAIADPLFAALHNSGLQRLDLQEFRIQPNAYAPARRMQTQDAHAIHELTKNLARDSGFEGIWLAAWGMQKGLFDSSFFNYFNDTQDFYRRNARLEPPPRARDVVFKEVEPQPAPSSSTTNHHPLIALLEADDITAACHYIKRLPNGILDLRSAACLTKKAIFGLIWASRQEALHLTYLGLPNVETLTPLLRSDCPLKANILDISRTKLVIDGIAVDLDSKHFQEIVNCTQHTASDADERLRQRFEQIFLNREFLDNTDNNKSMLPNMLASMPEIKFIDPDEPLLEPEHPQDSVFSGPKWISLEFTTGAAFWQIYAALGLAILCGKYVWVEKLLAGRSYEQDQIDKFFLFQYLPDRKSKLFPLQMEALSRVMLVRPGFPYTVGKANNLSSSEIDARLSALVDMVGESQETLQPAGSEKLSNQSKLAFIELLSKTKSTALRDRYLASPNSLNSLLKDPVAVQQFLKLYAWAIARGLQLELSNRLRLSNNALRSWIHERRAELEAGNLLVDRLTTVEFSQIHEVRQRTYAEFFVDCTTILKTIEEYTGKASFDKKMVAYLQPRIFSRNQTLILQQLLSEVPLLTGYGDWKQAWSIRPNEKFGAFFELVKAVALGGNLELLDFLLRDHEFSSSDVLALHDITLALKLEMALNNLPELNNLPKLTNHSNHLNLLVADRIQTKLHAKALFPHHCLALAQAFLNGDTESVLHNWTGSNYSSEELTFLSELAVELENEGGGISGLT